MAFLSRASLVTKPTAQIVVKFHPASSSTLSPVQVPRKLFQQALQTRSKMTTTERNAALRDANEKMKFYFENRPSLKVLNKNKKKFGDDNQHFIMAGTLSTFLCLFMFTPFLGRVSNVVIFFLFERRNLYAVFTRINDMLAQYIYNTNETK